MKILVLSFYFDPDLSAGSFRTTSLVDSLLQQLPANVRIEVVTTMPNRYNSFDVDVPSACHRDRLTVHRIALPEHKSGMIDQSRAFFAYVTGALRLTRREEYLLVYATSSRLMTAVLGSWIARRHNIPLYLDIRDIFLETIYGILSRKLTLLLAPVISRLERYALTGAVKVNLVSGGFAPYFMERYPALEYSFFTNGIDEMFLTAFDPIEPEGDNVGSSRNENGEGIPVALYAGNIGEGQGLHIVIPVLAQRMREQVRFKVIGDGGRRGQLEARLAALGVTNVEVLPPMKREELIAEYRAADILFLHLNDYETLEKVLPSKIFEYAATGKPIWAGVAGYAADFLIEHVDNAAVFSPCDVVGAVDAFGRLECTFMPRAEFVRRFSRRSISNSMAADIAGILYCDA